MSKLRQSAKGEQCTLRLVGVCNFNPETTVLAHLGRKRGMGIKSSDMHGCYACSSCHAVEEDKSDPRCTWEDRFRALEETQLILIEKGLLCFG